ncbi:hypothetical protein FLA_2850 [Filimonas lacunae]|nr:hypothetical protein FLA_2850 [Filimonas lacunae]
MVVATALGASTYAQTTINFPVSGGSYTVYAPAGYKFSSGPVSSGNGFIFSYSSTSDICAVSASANTTYYDRTVYATWTLTPKTGSGSAGTISYIFYQPGSVPPPFADLQDAVLFTPTIPLLNKQ